ncbi:toprim domain-containing protein [Halotalea alkalilenta]|uniref:Toprim domain-containing protein n=1 Tax=Halotalea alkalilenta TaxID=376489 RepID=A0A172YC74_9GAMM|nr:toprim domain-containing protein [Halotalea alkalilenta]ANF56818.1 hypothetical protein A5892_04500 [Halotalea alkalilenta]
MNFQFIGPQGTKRFRPGGRVTGCYHSFGEFSLDRPLLIAEGWATAMTLHEATGLPVAAAMNAGNLRSVAESLRARYPSIAIIVCADNDHSTTGNPGVTKGKDAASAVGGICIWPEFAAGDPGSDFNDAVLSGAKVVL